MRPIFGNTESIVTRKLEYLFDLRMRLHALRNTPPTGFQVIDNKSEKEQKYLKKRIKELKNEIETIKKAA